LGNRVGATTVVAVDPAMAADALSNAGLVAAADFSTKRRVGFEIMSRPLRSPCPRA
jgi:hypothetical protein